MRLFISYARVNRKQVEELQDVLRRTGNDAWFDEEIIAGDDWWQTILNSIESCDIFVLALTPESTNSDACRAEFQYAVTLNKPILPIMFREAELPIGKLAEIQFVEAKNLRNPDTILEISRALLSLQERINLEEFPEPVPKPKRPPFPFPPDPLNEVREKLENLRGLSEEELLGLVYRIKQVSRHSKRTAEESKSLLKKIATNHSLPYGIVQEARAVLNELLQTQKYTIRRYAMGAVLVLLVLIVGYFMKENAIPTITNNLSDAGTNTATFTLTPPPTHTPISSATNTATENIEATARAEDRLIATANAKIAVQTSDAVTETIASINARLTTTARAKISEATARIITVDNAPELQPLINPLRGHNGTTLSLDFSPDGRLLVSGSDDEFFRVWNLETQQTIFKNDFPFGGQINHVAFSPDGQYLVVAGLNGYILLLTVAPDNTFPGVTDHKYNSSIRDIAFSPDSQLIVVVDGSSNIKILNLQLQELRTIIGLRDSLYTVAFSPDGTLLATGGQRSIVRVWNLADAGLFAEFPVSDKQINNVRFSHDGSRVVWSDTDGFVTIKNIAEPVEDIMFRSARIQAIAFSPDDSMIAAASIDHSIHLWKVQTGEEIANLVGSEAPLQSLAFSPDGTLIAFGASAPDNMIHLWGLPDN